MNRRSLIILGLTALAMAVAVPLAFAHGPRGGGDRGERGERRGELIKKELGLNDKQSESLKMLRQDLHTDVHDVHEQIRTKETALRELWKAPTPDRAKIVAATAEIQKLEAQIDALRIDHLFAVKAELSAEQFGKFVELQKHGGKKWGRHGGKGGKHWRGDKGDGFQRQGFERGGDLEGEVH